LVAAGLHDSPFKSGVEGADFISMTTHKTLRGPRGALLFAKNYWPQYLDQHLTDLQPDSSKSKKSLIEIIDKTVFPGTSGGPHLNQIAAVGQSLLEILGQDQHPNGISFQNYSQNVVDNCKALENILSKNGLQIISPTQTHLCLVKLPEELDSLEVQLKLEAAGLITNRNKIPFDSKNAWRPSGLRLGTAALTSRGLTQAQAELIGELITDLIFDRKSIDQITKKCFEVTHSLNWWY
jgi:glycine hydroxymethyltransferase